MPKKQPKPSFKTLLQQKSLQSLPPGIVVALAVALGIAALSLILMEVFGGAEKIRGWISGAGAWAPLVYVGIKATTYVVAPLSGTPVKLAGGALFGFWNGAALGLAGDMLGASLNFWIARLFRDRGIRRLAGPRAISKIDELADHVGGWRALAVGRLVLASLYDFIAYAAGLSKLPYYQFFWVSLLAGIPSTLLSAWIGNAAVTNKPFTYALFGVGALSIIILLLAQRKPVSKK